MTTLMPPKHWAYWSSDIDGESKAARHRTLPVHCSTVLQIVSGLHTISLLVIDSQQESALKSIAITINELPDEPEIEIVHPTNGETGTENEPFSFVSQVFDAIDDLNLLEVVVTRNRWRCLYCQCTCWDRIL